ncbi:MAG: indolepyruvate ferredoxin oxidoreductase, partial [Phycisphaerae bacterium]|nr:indolepyruvate ferredoxin oxidoreductase [Phycisphaerae bacterium]
MKVDPRFLTSEGPEIFTGTELLLKGALETEGGVHLLGGYPGSPVAGFFDSMTLIKDLLSEKGIRAVMNNNEALAAAMLNGSQTVGCRAIIAMKSIGVHVAADALALGNLAGAHRDGGAIVIYGDDPWCDSTQVPADSRYISKHLYIPIFEPSNPQEVKDFVDLVFKVSSTAELYAGFVLPTNLADGGGAVQCKPNQYPKFNVHQKKTLQTARIDLDKFVLLPPRTWWQEASFPQRFARAIDTARELGLNKIAFSDGHRKPLGFVASGLAHDYLVQALWELGLLGEFPVLKFGMSYPLDADLLGQFAAQCDQIVVIEERRGFLEEQISQILLKDRQAGLDSSAAKLWGKRFPGGLEGIPSKQGLHPSILIRRLAKLLKHLGIPGGQGGAGDSSRADKEIQTIEATGRTDVGALPFRSATFCPACPHRDSASACLDVKKRLMDTEYMARKYGRGPVDLLFHGDTGCYTMLLYPPTTPLMHDYSGMGLGGGTGSGTD